MKRPLVSVLVLCFNHEKYVAQAIHSVLSQNYENIELIVIDDASSDNSVDVIQRLVGEYPDIKFLSNKHNIGNCKSFNRAFRESSGKYIVDLAGDDYFLDNKIELQVNEFERLPKDFGVVHSDAILYDQNDQKIGTHSEKINKIGRLKRIPEGFIFTELLDKYFISAPTQMIKRVVLEELGGYNENLAYEDFDFWMRSAPKWKYAFLDQALVAVRKLPSGMSYKMYGPEDPKVESTFHILKKVSERELNGQQKAALIRRIGYELRMSFKYRNRKMIPHWYKFYRKLGGFNPFYSIINYWN